MEVVSRTNYPDKAKTIYILEMNGRFLAFERSYYPELKTEQTFAKSPDEAQECSKEDEYKAKKFLEEQYPMDFSMPVLVRRRKGAFGKIQDTYYSPEQAMRQAERIWEESKKDKAQWICFYVKCNGKILRDWLA